MNLSHLWMLNLLWLIPLAAVVLIVQGRKKKRSLHVFADPHLLDRLTAINHRGRRFIKALFLLLSLGLMLFALAGPRWGSHYEEVSQKGVDIMLLIDVSPSMLVEDIAPNRLERARREILDFIKVVGGDRVGLIAFAGAAFIQCPLTLDYGTAEIFLKMAKEGSTVGGTMDAFGTAISLCLQYGVPVEELCQGRAGRDVVVHDQDRGALGGASSVFDLGRRERRPGTGRRK